MLDVNVWSYIAEQRAAESFVEVEHQLRLDTVIPPSILLEALHTRDSEQRRRLVRALTVPVRIHPRPEAQMQGREVVDEIRRLRPGWLRQMPATDRIPSLEKWWTRKVWQLARDSPDEAHIAVVGHQAADEAGDRLLAIQDMNKIALEEHRKEARGGGRKPFKPEAVDDAFVTFTDEAPAQVLAGWKGDRIEAWRPETALIFWHALVTVGPRAPRTGEDRTLGNWVQPWVHCNRLARSRSDWNRLWYYEVQSLNMPYNSLQWAVNSAQLMGKAGSKAPGNPVDVQHCAYLPEVDLFLTADQRLARVLNEVVRRAPVEVGDVLVVRHVKPIVPELERRITEWLSGT